MVDHIRVPRWHAPLRDVECARCARVMLTELCCACGKRLCFACMRAKGECGL